MNDTLHSVWSTEKRNSTDDVPEANLTLNNRKDDQKHDCPALSWV